MASCGNKDIFSQNSSHGKASEVKYIRTISIKYTRDSLFWHVRSGIWGQTRNVSIGHGCTHIFTFIIKLKFFGQTGRRTRENLNPLFELGHKNVQTSMYLCQDVILHVSHISDMLQITLFKLKEQFIVFLGLISTSFWSTEHDLY